MRVILQRVNSAKVTVSNEVLGEIAEGYLLYVGVGAGDNEADIDFLVDKILRLRIWPDEKGRFHYSILEKSFSILAISQFTLFADMSKGRRPSFSDAEKPEPAAALFGLFVENLSRALGKPIATGKFGAHMEVSAVNDGPINIWLDSREN